MVFGNGIKNIQAGAYNGARTVVGTPKEQRYLGNQYGISHQKLHNLAHPLWSCTNMVLF